MKGLIHACIIMFELLMNHGDLVTLLIHIVIESLRWPWA